MTACRFCGATMKQYRREMLRGTWWIWVECPKCGHDSLAYEEWEGPPR